MIANNNYQWPLPSQATSRKAVRVHNVDTLIALLAQITLLTNMMKAMTIVPTTVNQIAKISCVYYGERHLFDNCPGNLASVNYVGNFNRQNYKKPYSNTYSLRW